MKLFAHVIAAALAAMLVAAPAAAQIREVDPNEQIDADLAAASRTTSSQAPSTAIDRAGPAPYSAPADLPPAPVQQSAPPPVASSTAGGAALPPPTADGQYADATTYKRDDLIGAGEGVFGRGAEGLAGIIESILKEQGEPNAYIAGQEAAGAFIVGLRYGSGTMFHKVEGQRPVYWTGPSVGFDVGGDAAKTFVLVYNLYDSQELYKRYPQAEGRAYFVGGFAASYLRWGDVVLIPIRLGVGYRLGANVGYMKFSEKQRWLPF